MDCRIKLRRLPKEEIPNPYFPLSHLPKIPKISRDQVQQGEKIESVHEKEYEFVQHKKTIIGEGKKRKESLLRQLLLSKSEIVPKPLPPLASTITITTDLNTSGSKKRKSSSSISPKRKMQKFSQKRQEFFKSLAARLESAANEEIQTEEFTTEAEVQKRCAEKATDILKKFMSNKKKDKP